MPPSKTPNFSSILPAHLKIHSYSLLTSLWSNYGHIYRLTFTPNTTTTPRSLVLKFIKPPPASDSADESHLRKLLSYRVERYFYTNLSSQLGELAPVAKVYPVAETLKDEALLLEDLSVTYPYSGPYSAMHARAVLKWLANFHATYWRIEPAAVVAPPLKVVNPNEAEGVWEQGGYWYLDTRSEEMESLMSSAEHYPYLIPFVEYVAEKLRGREGGVGVTLLHGDCKAANIVFNSKSIAGSEEVKCALYDFQYVGLGLGVQDLAYFIGTSVDRRQLQSEEELLRFYYDELIAALGKKGVEENEYTWEVMIEQWEWALVDWMRFMAGWGSWGNSRWVEMRVEEICGRWEKEGLGSKSGV